MTIQAGFVLTTQGGPGLECFVVLDGTATVTVDGQAIATLGPGDCVGEMALLDGGRRSATVTADTTMHIYVLTVSEFRVLVDSNTGVRRRITAGLVQRLRTAPHA